MRLYQDIGVKIIAGDVALPLDHHQQWLERNAGTVNSAAALVIVTSAQREILPALNQLPQLRKQDAR